MRLTSVRSCLFLNFLALYPADALNSDHYHPEGQPCTKVKRGGNDVLIFPNEAASHIPRPHRKNTSAVDPFDRGGLSVDVDPSPCPGGHAYCDMDEDYPVDQIKELLKQQPKSLLGHFNVEVTDDGGNRFGPDGDEYELCPSNVKVIYPKKAKASNNNMFEFIVNVEDHRQGVRVEECVSGNECAIPGSLSLGYSSICVQKHIVRTLVVLNKDSAAGEGFVTKPFEFPSCCSCHITMSGSANRFGVPAEGPPTNITKSAGLKLTKS